MAVLVQTGGKIKITPTDYEQLINYTMLYDEGIENINWIKHTGAVKEATDTNTYGAAGSITKNSDHILLTKPASRCNVSVVTEETIGFSKYSKLHFKYNASSRAFYGLNKAISPIQVWKDEASFTESDINILDVASGDLFKTLDISQYANRNYYVSFGNYDTATVSGTLKLYNVVATKADDITTLCTKAGLSAPTSLDTLLADTTSLTAIFNNEDAVKFMVKQCTGDFMVGVLNSADAVALLKASPYLNTVVGNPHWAKFIMMIPTAKELLNVTMLYDEGDECEDITGGWSKGYAQTGSTITKNSKDITLVMASGGKTIGITTNNKIDFTDYSKLIADVSVIYNGATVSGYPSRLLYIGDYGANTSSQFGGVKSVTKSDVSFATTGDVMELDLLQNQAEYYPQFAISGQNNASVATAIINSIVMVKSDNWQTWASLGGVTATDLTTLIADSTKMATLMSNEEACKYLMGCTGDLMVSICNSETAMSALVNNIAYDYAFAHPVWYKFMTMCPVSLEAMDSVAVTVPTMTSNTAPSGIASASAIASSDYDAYKAFDKKTTLAVGNVWGSPNSSTTDQWVQYEFVEPISLYKFVYHSYNPSATSNSNIQNYKLQYSDDGVTFNDAIIGVFANPCNAVEIILEKPVTAKIWRLYVVDSYGTGSGTGLAELQFYGKAVTE